MRWRLKAIRFPLAAAPKSCCRGDGEAEEIGHPMFLERLATSLGRLAVLSRRAGAGALLQARAAFSKAQDMAHS